MNLTKGNYINGNWHFGEQLRTIQIFNPANKAQVVGEVQLADEKLIEKALEASKNAFVEWRAVNLKERIKISQNLLEELISKKDEIANIITAENGKTLKEAQSEVKAAVDESRFHIDYLASHQTEITGKTELRYEPLGTILAITPWNFPLATIMRKLIPAVVSGNTVIIKSSEYTPLTAIALFDLIHMADFPKGVLNLVNGSGGDVGRNLVRSEIIKAISFTGSNVTGSKILKEIGGRDVRLQAEMGGSNVVIVLNDANLETVVPDLVSNGFSCCGQWCTGTSRVVAENGIHDILIERLKSEIGKIKYGDGTDPQTIMGPLANERQFNDITKKIEMGIQEGAILEYGGAAKENETEKGYFVQPTLFSGVTEKMSIANEEIFGPVLTVIKANNCSHAITLANANPYGLSASIYTQNENMSDLFVEQIEAGLVHVNLPTAYRQYEMPLRGWKSSGMGIPECGRFMLDLFTTPKVVYSK